MNLNWFATLIENFFWLQDDIIAGASGFWENHFTTGSCRQTW